jgi:hypothetical protein
MVGLPDDRLAWLHGNRAVTAKAEHFRRYPPRPLVFCLTQRFTMRLCLRHDIILKAELL